MSYKIIHIDGGLGNQMCFYANLVSVRESNPGDDIYFEKFAYAIEESNLRVSQWNGYELERVFGIRVDDITDMFDKSNNEKILEELIKTRFWKNGWKIAENAADILKKHGLDFEFLSQSTGAAAWKHGFIYDRARKFVSWTSSNYPAYLIKKTIMKNKRLLDKGTGILKSEYYRKRDENCFYSMNFEFMKSPYLHEKIGGILRKELTFKDISDNKNLEILKLIKEKNSVSVHARRSDYLQYNNDCYRFGYFKKAVKFIKKKVENPVFFIFSEESDWCRNNLKILGLDENADEIYFIDWNKGTESYRDMQLMSLCKHNIITESSFGWWATFLNNNPNKITISQISPYITTHQF